MREKDLDVRTLARLFDTLPAHLPISDAMEAADPQKVGCYWSSQREHMVNWFAAQETRGSGAYTRQEPNRSGRATYNRLQCPEALIWIVEALGADTVLVESVATAALEEVPRRSRSAFVRKHFPWEFVAELACAHVQPSKRRPSGSRPIRLRARLR